MLICSIDTSGRNGSLALARYAPAVAPGVSITAAQVEIVEVVALAGGEYSAQLIPVLAATLKKHGLEKSAIDLFVAASGPGSFTGLRVGLSTVKALADALKKPIVAVGVLEAVALASGRHGRIVAALDAQRGEVYGGAYSVSSEFGPFPMKTEHEALSTVEQFCAWLGERNPPRVTFTPDAALAERIRKSGSPVEEIARPQADVYARGGLMRFAAGETVTAEALDANYIRRSDAEIFANPNTTVPPKANAQ